MWKKYRHKYDRSIVYLARRREDGNWELKRFPEDIITEIGDQSFALTYEAVIETDG